MTTNGNAGAAAGAFDDWLGAAWDRHATEAAALGPVLLAEGLPLVRDENQLVSLAHLAQHVWGEHLGRFAEGRAALASLPSHPAAGDTLRARLRIWDAALALAGGASATDPRPGAAATGPHPGAAATDPRAGASGSERVRITALAAGHLVVHDAARATALLDEALAEEERLGLADDDPAVRALAVTANNLAAELADRGEKQPASLDTAATALMLKAAHAARAHWARAGTWLETERAEWRLAVCHLVAGELEPARRHAEACLEIVRAHGSPPLEAFFGWEALGRVERAAGHPAGHAEALARARAAFEALPESDRGWCRPTLDRLEAAAVL